MAVMRARSFVGGSVLSLLAIGCNGGALNSPVSQADGSAPPMDATPATDGDALPSETPAWASALCAPSLGERLWVQSPDDMRTDTAPQLPMREPPTQEQAQRRSERNPYRSTHNAEPLAAACGALVFRALERAGNRLRNAHPRIDTTSLEAADVYRTVSGSEDKLLAGAWDCAAEVLGPYLEDPGDVSAVVDTLDFYVRGLLSTKRPHSDVVLAALLASRPTPIAIVPG